MAGDAQEELLLESGIEPLEISERSFRQVFDEAPIGLALVSPDGRFLRVNESLGDIVGYTPEELLEMDFQRITHPDDLDLDLEYVRQTLAGERRDYQMEKRYLHSDGRVVWVQLNVSLVRDADGSPLHFVSQIQDITQRKALEKRLIFLASHDEMTGLANRRRFDEELQRQVAYATRYSHRLTLLLLDLDNFKEVNDTLGHPAGDQLVRAVAARLRSRMRQTDLLARVGGDEFAIVLPESEVTHAQFVAQELVDRLAEEPFIVDGMPLWTRASIGVAVLDPDNAVGPDALLMEADRAMYEAKGLGGNRFAFSERSARLDPR